MARYVNMEHGKRGRLRKFIFIAGILCKVCFSKPPQRKESTPSKLKKQHARKSSRHAAENDDPRFVHAGRSEAIETRQAAKASANVGPRPEKDSTTAASTQAPRETGSLPGKGPGSTNNFDPQSFRARAAKETAHKAYQQVAESDDSSTVFVHEGENAFFCLPGSSRGFSLKEDSLGDPIADVNAASASLLSELPASPSLQIDSAKTRSSKRHQKLTRFVKVTSHVRDELASGLLRDHSDDITSPKATTQAHEHCHSPAARDLSYTRRIVRHQVLDQGTHWTMPSLVDPTPQLNWAGMPVILGRIPGTYPKSQDPHHYLRLMIDTGAEKTMIKRSKCPPDTRFIRMPLSEVGGLGGNLLITHIALFKLIFQAKNPVTGHGIDVSLTIFADVIDNDAHQPPAMRDLDAIFGYPSLLANEATIVTGNKVVGSAKITLSVPTSDIHDPSVYRDSVFLERKARCVFEYGSIDEGPELPDMTLEGWQPHPLECASQIGIKRKVEIPVAQTTGYSYDPYMPMVVEDWYDGGGKVQIRSAPSKVEYASWYGAV